MTLDEAIKHAEEVAKRQENNAKNYPRPKKGVKGSGRKYNAYLKCAEEHRQLAEWLKDYKRLLEQEPYEELDFVQPHKKIPVNLEVCKMREATPKEREGVERYIDSIAEFCEDCVSRQAAIDAFNSFANKVNQDTDIHEAIEIILNLPSVNSQEPKIGYWYIDERPESNKEIICSNCEQPVFKFHKLDFDYRPHYCPNCGAKME